jgi:hypothetical protein
MKSPHRRAFLKAVGAGLATLPFYRMLEHSFAQSAGGELPPLKFIGIYHPHGIAAEHWVMRDTDTERAFDLRFAHSTLRAFDDPARFGKSFKDRILLIEGIDLLSSANGHDSAATILTGSSVADGRPQNLSLDQFLAVEHHLGDVTPVTSIALAVGDPELAAGFGLSFGPGGHPLSKVIDPVEAFDTLFRGVVVGNDPGAQKEAERQRRRGKSVIDFVRADVNRLRGRLAPEEQHKLDQHLYSLRDIEKQLTRPPGAMGCGALRRPDAFPVVERRNGAAPYFDAITDAHIDLLAQAIACDVTRFGTLFMADLAYDENPLGLPPDIHGAVAHTYAGRSLGTGKSEQGIPSTWLPLAKMNGYSFDKIARLMQRLDGLSVLDSTLIYASSDMGDPAQHSTYNVPTLLAGGVNGKFRMGRRLRMANDCPSDDPLCAADSPGDKRISNNKILVSIAQAFGVDTDSFGTQADPRFSEGALTELT